MSNQKNSPKGKPGPKPETIKSEDADWREALKHALGKKKPKDGWTDQEKDEPKSGKPD